MPEGLLGMFAVSERASRDDKVGLEQIGCMVGEKWFERDTL
jgi:hypothetical protein